MKKIFLYSIFVLYLLLNLNVASAESRYEELFIKTVTHYNSNGEIIGSFETQMQENELLADMAVSTASQEECAISGNIMIPCYTTDYKRIRLDYSQVSNTTYKYHVQVMVFWYKVPLITKYMILPLDGRIMLFYTM